MASRQLTAAYAVAVSRLERFDRLLPQAHRLLRRRPTSRNAARVGVLQVLRADINRDLAALNEIAAADADLLFTLAFGKKRKKPKPRPRPRPADDEETDA